MPSVYDLLCQAIAEKKQVLAVYDGFPREMCPHVLGWKDGVRHVFSYQFAGESSKGLPPEGQWKCMDVDGLSNVALRDGPWHTGIRKTGKPQSCVDLAKIDIQVAF
jgi:hypothetical protein